MQFNRALNANGAAPVFSDLVNWRSNRKFKQNVGRIKGMLRNDGNMQVFELAMLLAKKTYSSIDRTDTQTRLLTEMLEILRGQNKHKECTDILSAIKNAHPDWTVIPFAKTELRRFGALQI